MRLICFSHTDARQLVTRLTNKATGYYRGAGRARTARLGMRGARRASTWQECFALLGCAHEGTVKEILVVRDPPSLLVFNVVEHGRRFIRCLEWTSDCSGALESRVSRRVGLAV